MDYNLTSTGLQEAAVGPMALNPPSVPLISTHSTLESF
jgi:hypothetical protein